MWYAIAVAVCWVLLGFAIWQRAKANRYGRHAAKSPSGGPSKTLRERIHGKDPDDLLGKSLKTCVVATCAAQIHVFSDVCRHCGGFQPMQDDVETVRISVQDARRPVQREQVV